MEHVCAAGMRLFSSNDGIVNTSGNLEPAHIDTDLIYCSLGHDMRAVGKCMIGIAGFPTRQIVPSCRPVQ